MTTTRRVPTFRVILYGVVCPLLLYNSVYEQPNFLLFACFIAILLSHLHKDYFRRADAPWPGWTEPFGFLIGFVLAYISQNLLVKILGVCKMAAHVRQVLVGDGQYYALISS
jgi:hypothetical protein